MKVVIIGAGLTGLSAAKSIGKKAEVRIFERHHRFGGLARTIQEGSFKHDLTGHFLHFRNKKTERKVKNLFKRKELLKIHRRSFIYFRNTYVPFPFQSHIYYLPEEIKKECLIEFTKNLKSRNNLKKDNLINWMNNRYGKGITKYFMRPYNEKMWQFPLNRISTKTARRFFPDPSPEEIITGAVTDRISSEGYNAVFYYPRGGIGELVVKIRDKVGHIDTECNVMEVNWKEKKIKVEGSETYLDYEFLITTCPLKEFITNILIPKDEKLLEYAEKLRYTSVLNINIEWKGSPGKKVPEGTHWIYFPENKLDFYRIGFLPAVSREMAPEGHYSCYVEISYKEGKMPSKRSYNNVEERVIQQLILEGIIPDDAKIDKGPVRALECAYVVYDDNWEESRNYILNWLEERSIFSGGRYGGWEYSSMDDAIEWGEKLAEKCLSR